MTEANIVNVVATADMKQKINLKHLGEVEEAIYNPDLYGGRVVYFKLSGMKGKVSVFSSGKMISIGSRKEREAFHDLEVVKNLLIEKGFVEPIDLQPIIRNLVVSVSFKKRIDLEALNTLPEMIYEPEQFPGGIIAIDEPYKIKVLIFASGKAVFAGLKSSKDIEEFIKKVEKLIDSDEFSF